jgi:LmbE family N-acetylglucosaminyl deacetylase
MTGCDVCTVGTSVIPSFLFNAATRAAASAALRGVEEQKKKKNKKEVKYGAHLLKKYQKDTWRRWR